MELYAGSISEKLKDNNVNYIVKYSRVYANLCEILKFIIVLGTLIGIAITLGPLNGRIRISL